jgi:hypothetical protein
MHGKLMVLYILLLLLLAACIGSPNLNLVGKFKARAALINAGIDE